MRSANAKLHPARKADRTDMRYRRPSISSAKENRIASQKKATGPDGTDGLIRLGGEKAYRPFLLLDFGTFTSTVSMAVLPDSSFASTVIV